MSGLGRLVFGGHGALRQHRAAAPYIPGDEVAQDRRPVPLAGEAPELFPQVVLDPDGSVRRVGLLHEPHRSPRISTVRALGVAVYIHGHYARGYTRRMQVALWGGRSRSLHRADLRCTKLGEKMASTRTLPAHENCNHTKYWLTCEQYEELLNACDNQCQTCGRPGTENPPHRKLFIDHDYAYGIWAVRGLLCGRCNGKLTYDKPAPEWAADYLADPWFKRAFAEMGVSIERQPEPPIGSIFKSPKGPTWIRTERCWQNESYAVSTRDWYGMCRDFSPVHLQHIKVATYATGPVRIVLDPARPWDIAEALRRHLSPQQRSAVLHFLGRDDECAL